MLLECFKPKQLAVYSITDLEKLSGIKAHTIRIWERRYKLIEPKRTKTNIRYYNEHDLRRLLNICVLNKKGVKISKLAKMSQDEIHDQVKSATSISDEYDAQLDGLTLAMLELDERKFNRIFNVYIKNHGFEQTIFELLNPFLEKLSLLWMTGSLKTCHEHFMTELIRRKVIRAIDSIPLPKEDAKRFLIFLPEEEHQELSLLFLNYVCRARGFHVVNLGKGNALEDIASVREIFAPDFVYTIITESHVQKPVRPFLHQLCESFPESHVFVSGYQIVRQRVKSEGKLEVVASLNDAISRLDEIV